MPTARNSCASCSHAAMKHPLPPNCSDSYNNTAALCRKIAIFAATDPLPHSCQQSYGRYRTHPREYFRCRPPRSDIGAHRHPCPPRSLHSGYRPGRHPPLAVAGHPFQNLLGPLWRHNERPALQVLRAKCGNPLHSREPRGIRRVGGPAGQEPLDYHHSRHATSPPLQTKSPASSSTSTASSASPAASPLERTRNRGARAVWNSASAATRWT